MKKMIVVALVIVLTLGLSACGKTGAAISASNKAFEIFEIDTGGIDFENHTVGKKFNEGVAGGDVEYFIAWQKVLGDNKIHTPGYFIDDEGVITITESVRDKQD